MSHTAVESQVGRKKSVGPDLQAVYTLLVPIYTFGWRKRMYLDEEALYLSKKNGVLMTTRRNNTEAKNMYSKDLARLSVSTANLFLEHCHTLSYQKSTLHLCPSNQKTIIFIYQVLLTIEFGWSKSNYSIFVLLFKMQM